MTKSEIEKGYIKEELTKLPLISLAFLLTALYWTLEDYWFRWFGIIGYLIIGANWK